MRARFCRAVFLLSLFYDSIILIAICFFYIEFAQACPDIDRLVDINCDKKLKIVCFGDSITYGLRDTLKIGYPGRLKKIFPHAIIYNQGIPGETSEEGRIRAIDLFKKIRNPDYVIILEGVNDYWLDLPSESLTANNLRSIADTVRTTGGLPLMATLTPSFKLSQYTWVMSVNSLIQGDAMIDFFSLGPKILSLDNLHPNDYGYGKMAKLVAYSLRVQSVLIRPIDTDGDGVYDFEEKIYGTSKIDVDTDRDTLPDGDELYKYKTNPLVVDSDGDGLSDGLEVKTLHSNPRDARPSAPKISGIEVLLR